MRKIRVFIRIVITVLFIILRMNTFAQVHPLKAGIARTDITPFERLYMGGYDSYCRSEPSQDSDGKIFVRALVFDDNKQRTAFVEIDIVSFPNDEYPLIRKLISARTG